MSCQTDEGQSQCPENGTQEDAKGRWENKCSNLVIIQKAAWNDHLTGLYHPQGIFFHPLRNWLQVSKDTVDVSLDRQICRYRALQQHSAEKYKQAHKTNLQDGRNASNHNLNYLRQLITFQHCILRFKIRELHLQALVQRPEESTASRNVLPSGADLAAPHSSQWYAKPEFMGLPNRHDGKHPDGIIKDFRALLHNTQDATHHMTIYNGTWEWVKHQRRNKTYISDEQLHTMELCSYHGIKVQVDGLEGECISQICRFTGSQSWCRGDRRKD